MTDTNEATLEAASTVSLDTGTAGGRLLQVCLDHPESVQRGLDAVLSHNADNAIALAARDLAKAVLAFQSVSHDGAELSDSLAEAANDLVLSGDHQKGASALAMAVALGASSTDVQALSKQVLKQLTAEMRAAINAADDDVALARADLITGLSPDMAEGWLVAGRMKLKQGRVEEALRHLEKAADLSPTSQNTILNLARAECAADRHREAMLNLFKLLRLADASDGRYRPLAVAELETLFHAIAQAAARMAGGGDDTKLVACLSMMEEIAGRVAGSVIEYVASARNLSRAAIGYARTALAVGQGRRGIAACEAAVEIEPRIAGLWGTIARLRLHFNDNAQAAQAFRQSLAIDATQPSMLDGLAEALFRDGKLAAAAEAAEQAVASDQGNAAIAARQERIAAAVDAGANVQPDPDSRRHVAILGVPNLGAARLGAMLARATGSAFVGDSFWVAGQGEGDAASRKYSGCQTCRTPDCSRYGLSFRQGITDNTSDWYQRIAAASGQRVLVSNDNSAQIVRGFDPALACDAIVALRAPANAWALVKEHYRRQKRPLPSLSQFLQGWYRTYAAILGEFPLQGRLVVVDMDGLKGHATAEVSELAEALELSIAASDSQTDEHFFGIAPSELENGFPDVQGLADGLPAAERKFIEGYADATELYEKLSAI